MNRITVTSLAAIGALAVIGAGWATGAFAVEGRTMSCCAGESGAADAGFAVKHTLTLDGANRVLGAAIARARERGAGGAIAVVDDGGALLAFQRIDGTFAAGAAVSIGKARTAAIFKKPTRAFEDSINGGRTALAAVHEMTPLQGGIPIVHEGHVIGGIGVSGAHSQAEDEEIALAGAGALGDARSAAK